MNVFNHVEMQTYIATISQIYYIQALHKYAKYFVIILQMVNYGNFVLANSWRIFACEHDLET